jgi:integrase/recombinase XerC
MQDIFNKYVNYLEVERNASRYTIRNYTHDLLDFFTFLKNKGIKSLNEVDRLMVREYLAHLVQAGFVKSSIARRLSAIRSLYRYLLREQIVSSSPVANTTSPKLDKRLPDFLTPNEVASLLQSPDLLTPQGQRDRAILELLYASGLRVSELVSLDIEQVNLHSNEIRVWGKGAKERVVLMGEPAANALRTYLSQGRPELLGEKKSRAIFINRYGKRLIERRVQRILERYTAIAGIKKRVHPHTLRHTFATHLLDGGADLRVVQELLGHANLTSTQVYTHVTKSQAKKVYLAAHPLAQDQDQSDTSP